VTQQNQSACGLSGAACASCGTQTCNAGVCGTTTGCTALTFTAVTQLADFDAQNNLTYALQYKSAAPPTDSLELDVNHNLVTTLPASKTFSASDTLANCGLCALYATGCTEQGCAKYYLAQGGTANVTSAPATASGTFSGSISNVKFQEWNLSGDSAVAGGACFTLGSASFNATW
jgi:hypothetical protein